MKKGVIIMENVSVREHHYLKFSSITLNRDSPKERSISKDNVQQRLEFIEDKIQDAYMDIILYALEHKTTISIKLEEILKQYDHSVSDGIPVINKLISQLNHKQLSKENIEYLNTIIDYQWKMTEKMIVRPLTVKNIETRYNHLLNVSHYLEADLEIESLPDLTTIDIAIRRKKSEKLVSYDLNMGFDFYNTGA